LDDESDDEYWEMYWAIARYTVPVALVGGALLAGGGIAALLVALVLAAVFLIGKRLANSTPERGPGSQSLRRSSPEDQSRHESVLLARILITAVPIVAALGIYAIWSGALVLAIVCCAAFVAGAIALRNV
jgi:hypothetical protein